MLQDDRGCGWSEHSLAIFVYGWCGCCYAWRPQQRSGTDCYLTYCPEDVQCILVYALPRSREPFLTFYRFSAGCLGIRFYHILLPSPPRHCVWRDMPKEPEKKAQRTCIAIPCYTTLSWIIAMNINERHPNLKCIFPQFSGGFSKVPPCSPRDSWCNGRTSWNVWPIIPASMLGQLKGEAAEDLGNRQFSG